MLGLSSCNTGTLTNQQWYPNGLAIHVPLCRDKVQNSLEIKTLARHTLMREVLGETYLLRITVSVVLRVSPDLLRLQFLTWWSLKFR